MSQPCACLTFGFCDRHKQNMDPMMHAACQGVPEMPQDVRKIIMDFVESGPPQEPPKPPPLPALPTKAWNYVKAMAKHTLNGFAETTPEERDRRASLCRSCVHHNAPLDSCSLCGCPIEKKARVATEGCPAGSGRHKDKGPARWGPQVVTHKNPVRPFSDEDDLRYDANDIKGLHGIPPEPCLLDPHGDPADHPDLSGRLVYLVGGGPSLDLSWFDRIREARPDAVTMGLNNVAQVLKTDLWMCIDDPADPADRFHPGVWADPDVVKIVPLGYARRRVAGGLVVANPGMLYFVRNYRFRTDRFLSESSFTVGNQEKQACEFGIEGARSVMLPALKALHLMGARKVVILGADFVMKPEKPYIHNEPKKEPGCRSNTEKFKHINTRFMGLRPRLEMAGMRVYNATPGGDLTAFERVTLDGSFRL